MGQYEKFEKVRRQLNEVGAGFCLAKSLASRFDYWSMVVTFSTVYTMAMFLHAMIVTGLLV